MIMYMIYGIPGSGKTTHARKIIQIYQDKNIPILHYEADMFFEKDGKYNFNPKLLNAAHSWCKKMVKEAMENKIDVIVSNTSLTPKERKVYFKLAKLFDYEIQVISLNNTYPNIHGVPKEKIEIMKKRYVPFNLSELDFEI